MEADRLVNCTGTPHWVRVDGQPVPLDELPPPSIHSSVSSSERLVVDTIAGLTELDVEPGEVSMTMHLPAPRPGVLYLVRPEVLLRCPHRGDFVTPAAYERTPHHDVAAPHPPKVLVAVHRDLCAVDELAEDMAGPSRAEGVATSLRSALAAADAGDVRGVFEALAELRGTSPTRALGVVMAAGAALCARVGAMPDDLACTAETVGHRYGSLMGSQLPNTGSITPIEWYRAILEAFVGNTRHLDVARVELAAALGGEDGSDATSTLVLVFAIGVLWHLTAQLTTADRAELLTWAAAQPQPSPRRH